LYVFVNPFLFGLFNLSSSSYHLSTLFFFFFFFFSPFLLFIQGAYHFSEVLTCWPASSRNHGSILFPVGNKGGESIPSSPGHCYQRRVSRLPVPHVSRSSLED
jgi:hypothetical protein